VLISAHQRGQGLLEYALIITLVAIIVLVILALLGPAIGSLFSNIIPKI
jgi:pilus assembly protein Flp/PilA